MTKLTYENQGLIDRLQRAESWIAKAKTIEDWEDHHGQFIFYWIVPKKSWSEYDSVECLWVPAGSAPGRGQVLRLTRDGAGLGLAISGPRVLALAARR